MNRLVESVRSALSGLTPPIIPDANTILEIVDGETYHLPLSHPTTIALIDCVGCLREKTCQRPDLHEAYPDYLKIDRTVKQNGKLKQVSRHLVVATGMPASQWPNKLERGIKITDDTDLNQQAMMLPGLLNHEVTESWARGAVDDGIWLIGCAERCPAGELMVFPEYQYVQLLNEDDCSAEAISTLDRISQAVEDLAIGEEPYGDSAYQEMDSIFMDRIIMQPIPYRAVIMICAHARRDKRFGVTGPILHRRFTEALAERGEKAKQETAIFMTSYTDDPKTAGNVIIYPAGIWYGFVNTCHVDAIIDRTVYGNEVIRELYRGRLNAPTKTTHQADIGALGI